ncbi:unnamed protein product [Sphagnum balticum]
MACCVLHSHSSSGKRSYNGVTLHTRRAQPSSGLPTTCPSILPVDPVFAEYRHPGRLITPFMVWDLQPQPTLVQIGLLQSVTSTFLLIGTFLCGQMVDSHSMKFTAVLAAVLTSVYIMIASQTKIMWLMACERYSNREPQNRRSQPSAVSPLSQALIVGPWMAGTSFRFLDYNVHTSYAISGALLLLILTPVILFTLPEPRAQHVRPFSEGGWLAIWDRNIEIISPSYLTRTPILPAFDRVTNGLLMRPLQRHFTVQRLLQIALGVLVVAYGLLSIAESYFSILMAMPLLSSRTIAACGPTTTYTGAQWSTTLMQFIYWDISPPMSIWNIGCVQTFAALCNAFGAFICGQVGSSIRRHFNACRQIRVQFVDIAGSKSVFIFSAIATCLYYAGVSQVHTFIGILFVNALRCGNHFDAGSEMYLVNEIMGYGISAILAIS